MRNHSHALAWDGVERRSSGSKPPKVSPPRNDRGITDNDICQVLDFALETAYRHRRDAAKKAAQDAQVTPRTAENWIGGENTMSLKNFVKMWHANPTFRAEAARLFAPDGVDINRVIAEAIRGER